MAQEAAQLSGVCAQLAQRVDAADAQVTHLEDLSAALLSNIADKEAAMTLEEKVALLDGRMCVAVPPTPSVLSVSITLHYLSKQLRMLSAGTRLYGGTCYVDC